MRFRAAVAQQHKIGDASPQPANATSPVHMHAYTHTHPHPRTHLMMDTAISMYIVIPWRLLQRRVAWQTMTVVAVMGLKG